MRIDGSNVVHFFRKAFQDANWAVLEHPDHATGNRTLDVFAPEGKLDPKPNKMSLEFFEDSRIERLKGGMWGNRNSVAVLFHPGNGYQFSDIVGMVPLNGMGAEGISALVRSRLEALQEVREVF